MSCVLTFPNSNVAKALRKITGTNDALYASYLSEVLDGVQLSKEFVDWYSKKHPNAKEVSTDASDGVSRNIAKGIVEYFNYYSPDGHSTVRRLVDDKAREYDSIMSRNLGKKIVGSIILRGYNTFFNVKHNDSKYQTREDYERFAEGSIVKNVINLLAKKLGISTENTIKEFIKSRKASKEEAFHYIQNLIEGVDLSIQEQNQIAILGEILTNSKGYFDEVFKDSRISSLVFKKEKDDVSEQEKAAMNAEVADEMEDDDSIEDYFDESIRVFDNHDGIFKTFEMHVNGNIRNYFNGLKRLSSTRYTEEKLVDKNGNERVNKVYDEDTNNSVGIADTMSAAECMAVMYTSVNYASVDTMIDSVRKIADTMPGMEAFAKFADDLLANRDFACEVYRTFGKQVISKTEVVKEGNEMVIRRTNKFASRLEALKLEFINTSRDNSISDIEDYVSKQAKSIREKIDKKDKGIIGIAKDLANALRLYYPTISDAAILNYIESRKVNNYVNKYGNAKTLLSILETTISGARKTHKVFNERKAEAAKAHRHNRQLQEKAFYNDTYVDESKLIDTRGIWAIDFISDEHKKAAINLAQELVDYSVVRIELNSRNVEGNLSSDVINSSYITNFIEMLGSELNDKNSTETPLAKFGKWKLQGKQYNLSNILIEQKEGNKIISYGLFTKQGETYIPTAYARDLIAMSLFAGASDRNQSKNVLYKNMSTGDYIATALAAFHNDDRKSESGIIRFGSYFLRTPSDAPKNFLVSAPRYSTKYLFKDDSVNRNHIIFKQYKNLVKQEILNATVALETIFEVNDGVVRLENGKPVLNQEILTDKDAKHNLFKNYHYNGDILEYVNDEGKVVPETDPTGHYRLTGNVFNSTKLTYVDENGVQHNLIQELINDSPYNDDARTINFLYGGAQGHPITIGADGNVVISQELETAIEDKIEEFLKAFVKDGQERVHKFDDLLKSDEKSESIKYTEDDINDFLINYHLMYNAFDDLFEGDAKFYGSGQDFLKRAKEVQGSGVPYAKEMSDTFGDIYDGNRNLIDEQHSALEGSDFASIRESLNDMHLYDKFRAVTIRNTIKTDEVTKPDGALSQELQRAGLSKEQANKLMAGYANTTVNDAQSYITFEEWVRRITLRGQLYKYKPLIEAILDESKPLTVNEIKEFVQVQKNFYYDQAYDKRTGVIHPRQIKNAEFVLVPRFIKGTELEQVYNAMVEAGIDQLNTEETSKAGKSKVLTLWNEKGVLTQKALNEFTEKAKSDKDLFDYKHLYTQQETPQHVDAENKAGIQVMKKIIDNIDENSSRKLQALKKKFVDNFTANVRDSYFELCKELGIELDSNGNIQIDEKTRKIKGLDYTKLNDKAVQELNRLSANSQMYDYVEYDENGMTKMPQYFNSTYYKLQNIFQALFNNGITRQKLPGFHAAQITQVGFRPFSKQVSKRTYSDALQYHPQLYKNAEGNEIPEREYNKLSDEDKKKYKKSGVAPYIEIMLPKANFGLSHLSDEEALKQLQEAKVDEIIGYRIPTEGKQSICVMKVVGFTDDALGSTIVVPDGWVAQTGSDFDIDSVYGIHWETYLDKNGNLHKVTKELSDREHYNNYVLNKLRTSNPRDYEIIRNNSTIEKDDISLEEAHEAFESDIDFYAKQNKIESFDEFKKNKLSKRTRAARNNEILDAMIGILQDPASLEENLSRSNSDDLESALGLKKGSKGVLPRTFIDKRKGRSPYNFLDQADYQSDAMSGAALKAFSVTRDTLCSVANTCKPILEPKDAIFVKYRDGRKVQHNCFGWSNDGHYGIPGANRNIEGKLITIYSSQTTAFILDAIKKGAIPNVNNLTFATFKTFVDLGSTYDLAVAFMAQPAITRIVDGYYKGNSIYNTDSLKPVDDAIISIAKELGYEEKNPTSRKALEYINGKKEFIEKVNKYLNRENKELTGRPADIEHTFIDEAVLRDRIDEKGNFTRPVEGINEESLAFDLANILVYNKLSYLSGQISNIAQVLNPDKFGAKQTLYATRKVFDDIADIITDDKCPLKVEVNGRKMSMVEAIYPGIVLPGSDNTYRVASLEYFLQHDGKSLYPILYTFLKYATAPSIKVNQTLFATQSETFVDNVKKITGTFSGRSGKLKEDRYNDVERYYLTYIYSQLETLANGTIYVPSEGFKIRTDISQQEEQARIYGFNRSADLLVKRVANEEDIASGVREGNTYYTEFSVKDPNNPTEQELEEFAQLSPAQKVAWVQKTFRDSLVCKYLKVDLSNRSQSYNTQTISYCENMEDIEVVFQSFKDTFYNSNPLLAMTAMDLIKYSFIAEGFRMKKGAVNKILENEAIYNEFGINGTGIAAQLMREMSSIDRTFTEGLVDKLTTRYVRAHMDMAEIGHVYYNYKKDTGFKNLGYNVFYVDDIDTIVRKQLGYREYSELEKQEVPVFNKFVVITRGKIKTLYKIIPAGSGCFLYPLNKLEANETTEWSANVENNKFPNEDFYEDFIKQQVDTGVDFTSFKIQLKQHYEAHPDMRYTKPEKIVAKEVTKDFNINDKRTYINETRYPNAILSAIDKITEFFKVPTDKTLYIKNQALDDIIKETNSNGKKEGGTIQTINGKQYHIYKTLYKPEGSKFNASTYIAIEELNDTESLASSVEEKLLEDHNDIIKEFKEQGTAESKIVVNQARNAEMVATEDSIKAHMETAIAGLAQYVTTKVDNLLNKEGGLRMFTRDESTGEFIAMNDSRLKERLATDPKLRRNLIKNILEARAIISRFKEYDEFDMSAEDVAMNHNLSKIKQAIKELRDAKILNEAEELYVNEYLKRVSKNPLIKKDIITVLDGFHSTCSLEYWFHDLQETGSPLLQVVTKDVMADIRGRDLAVREEVDKFRKTIKKFKDKGVKLDKLVDKKGKLIRDYNETLEEDYTALWQEVDKAKELYGIGSIQHLKAKAKYDEFKLNNFNQELPDEYYAAKLELEKDMLEKYPTIYSKYKTLTYDLSDVLSFEVDGELDEAKEAERKAINRQIQNLRSRVTYYPDGTFALKTDLELQAAKALDKFIKDMRTLNEEYYTFTEDFGFDELLELNQDIIRSAEADAALGKTNLDTNEAYKKAKEWMHKNTRYVYEFDSSYDVKDLKDNEVEAIINGSETASFPKRVKAALIWLHNGKITSSEKPSLSHMYAKDKEAYDEKGSIDARKFSEDEIKSIKEEQENKIRTRQNGILDETSIINNGSQSKTVYTKEFYEAISGHGVPNQEFIKIVQKINDVLRNAYDKETSTLRTSLLSENEINDVIRLIEPLGYKDQEYNVKDKNRIKPTQGVSRKRAKEIKEFIDKYCESDPNMDAFRAEERAAQMKGNAYYNQWCRLNYEFEQDDEGYYRKVPNRLLWGGLKIKDSAPEEIKKKYIDTTRTNAVQILNEAFDTRPTEYYHKALNEAASKGEEEFNKWFNENHIYNPYTHTMEPIECWMQRTPKENMPGHYEASFAAKTRSPREVNKYYRDGVGMLANYKTRAQIAEMKEDLARRDEEAGLPIGEHKIYAPDEKYNNNVVLNKDEQECKRYIENLLYSYAYNKQAKDFLDKGYMIARSKGEDKDAMGWLKEFAKQFGIVEGQSGKDLFDEKLGDYQHDFIPDMPMTHLISTKSGNKELEALNTKKPERKDYSDDATFEQALDDWYKEQNQIKKIKEREHSRMIDTDYEAVIEDFIIQASHYKALQDNKYALYMGQELLSKIGTYQTKYSSTGRLEKDRLRSDEEQGVINYVKVQDNSLQDQYKNWIRRLIFDQYKKQQGYRTNAMSRLQAFTSTNYMAMNIRGGIANITLGETTVLGEAVVGSVIGGQFGLNHWRRAKGIWSRGILDFTANAYKDYSSTLVGAICKDFNIIDYDEIQGNPRKLSLDEFNDRLRNFAFSPQTAGEHFMQNGALIAMLISHKLVKEPHPSGIGYSIMSEKEYIQNATEKALNEVMSDDSKQKWIKYLDKIKKDANITKDYAWWRKDLISDFLPILTVEERREFKKTKKKYEEEAKKKFNEYESLYDQLELGDNGKLKFKDGSGLANLNVTRENQDMSDAYKLLGEFKGKVVSVNKYIHGVYDKTGAALLEREWYGAIVMQYHKHIPMGIAKWYRSQGYFNEERGTVEKGIFASIKDFLMTDARATKTKAMLSDAEVNTIESLQNTFKSVLTSIWHIKSTWDITPDHDKANIIRGLCSTATMLSAVCFAIAVKAFGDDDDDDIMFNLMFYEADRLASESWQFTPVGAYAEAKKLFSQPIAAQSIINDIISGMGQISTYIMSGGDDESLIYKSGRFAGQNKLTVYFERRIPIYRNVKAILDIADNNRYYKLSQNMVGFIDVEEKAKWLKGKH